MCVCVCVCVFQIHFNGLMDYFLAHKFPSHINIFRILSVSVVYLLSWNSYIWHKSSRRKICLVSLVNKKHSPFIFSFDNKITFSRRSFNKPEEIVAVERKLRIVSIREEFMS